MTKKVMNKKVAPAVRALIEVSIVPQKDVGFDRIAARIYNYPQVKSCYLVSGGYDLLVVVEGQNIQTVADFVAAKLSSMDGVRQTATHFLLRAYKEEGRVLVNPTAEQRENIHF